jgi:hypothetical protein
MIKQGTNILKEQANKRLEYDSKLEQINFLDRRVYKRSEGVYYPSVTTVLQYMPRNQFFENWLKDVGHNADLIARHAAKEGTQVHEAAEDLVLGREVSWMDDYGKAKYSEITWIQICRFAEFWKKHKPKLISSEEFVYSDTHRYAGTADLLVEMDGEIWLLDIKTSKHLHKSYNLQLSAYATAMEEMKGIKIDRTGIIWLKAHTRSESKKDGVYQGKGWQIKTIGEIEKNFSLFKAIYEFYRIDHPTTEPVYSNYPTTLKL